MSSAIRGRACSLDEAVAAAAALLSAARLPLVFGLIDSTVEAQREAVRLARRLRAVIDPATSASRAAARAAFARSGSLTTTLGEMRGQADLVVLWGFDPDQAHPDFMKMYAPARAGRVRLAVDVGSATGPEGVEERLALPANRETEALLVLRALMLGRRVEATTLAPLELPTDALRGLSQRFKNAAYGVIVLDGDPATGHRNPVRTELLTRLARDARRRARLRGVRLRVMPLHRGGNGLGAEQVLTWLTGFPAAVSFAIGAPRHDPHLWTAEALLSGQAIDAALVVGADPGRWLSAASLARLSKVPTVCLGGGGRDAAVFIHTDPFGSTSGHVFRTDGLVLRQEPVRTGLPTEADILARIADALPTEAAA